MACGAEQEAVCRHTLLVVELDVHETLVPVDRPGWLVGDRAADDLRVFREERQVRVRQVDLEVQIEPAVGRGSRRPERRQVQEARGQVYVLFDVSQRGDTWVNGHVYHAQRGTDSRQLQVGHLSDHFVESSHPVIVVGRALCGAVPVDGDRSRAGHVDRLDAPRRGQVHLADAEVEGVDLNWRDRLVRAVDDSNSGGRSGGIQQVDRLVLTNIDGTGPWRFEVDDRLHRDGGGCGENLAAYLDFEPDVEVAVRQPAGGERQYVQGTRRIVDQLLDLAEAPLGRVQPHGDRPLRRVSAEIQLDHFGGHLIQTVSVGVGRLAVGPDTYVHGGRPGQTHAFSGLAKILECDLGLGILEVVDFDGRVRLVTAGTEVITAELPRRVVQGDRVEVLVDVAGSRRLVMNDGAHPLRIDRKQRLPAHTDLEVHVEVTVRQASGRERRHVQGSGRVVDLLGDLTHRADVRMQQHVDRAEGRAVARQLHLDQLGFDLVQPVVVIVEGLALGRLEVDHRGRGSLDRDHFREAGVVEQLHLADRPVEAVDFDVARVVFRADDKHAGRVAVGVEKLQRPGGRQDVEVSRDRRLFADDRLDSQRLLVVQQQPAAHVQLEVHVEVAHRVAGGKRVQVQPVRGVVDKLLDLA